MNLYNILNLLIGILLLTYGILNINISQAPENLEDITNLYGKTFCIKVDQYNKKSKTSINNAFALMVVANLSGVLLILTSLLNYILQKK
jgi:hypothetical protein